jgi:hypothetical protein
MSGNLHFVGDGNGGVVNLGNITGMVPPGAAGAEL